MKNHLQRDAVLEAKISEILREKGIADLGIGVFWNSRLTTTAGHALFRDNQIHLNPKLLELEGNSAEEILRILRHELAHLLDLHFHPRKIKFKPHGERWKAMCAFIDIPNEPRCHTLPFKRRKMSTKFSYQCPMCKGVISRVRKFRRPMVCVGCCKTYTNRKAGKSPLLKIKKLRRLVEGHI